MTNKEPKQLELELVVEDELDMLITKHHNIYQAAISRVGWDRLRWVALNRVDEAVTLGWTEFLTSTGDTDGT